jgi:hypothetical protein
LYPSGVRVISPQAYVFVEERHFMEPIRSSTVVVNNTTIINKTVINAAPAPAVIEKASGQKVQALPVQELRHREEAAVVAKARAPTATSEQKVPTPVRGTAGSGEKMTVVAHALPQVEKRAIATHGSAAPAPKNSKAPSETRKPVPAAAESKPAAKSGANHPAAIKEPTRQNGDKQPVRQEKPAQPADGKAQRESEQTAKESPVASEKHEPNAAEQSHGNKGKE